MMDQWYQLEQIASSIRLSDVEDSLMWKLHSSGVYSSQSLYAVLNYRGMTPMFIPMVWKLNVPPRVQVFLWLLSYNNFFTRDNLVKGKILLIKLAFYALKMKLLTICSFLVIL
jgi:hypothetical protein